MSLNEPRTGTSTYNIDKLTESNYRSWSQQVKWILDELELWDIVDGKEVKPSSAEELAVWNKKAKKARSIIGASVTASVMTYIEGKDDPAAMWKVLEERYNPKTQTTLFQTIREFMNLKMNEGDDMEKHLQKVQHLKRKCEEQGEEISDNVYTAILLNSVSEEYLIAVAILESQEKLTPASILNRLMEEYRKVHSHINGNGIRPRIALLTAATEDWMANRECFYCGQRGHMKRECPVRKFRQEKQEQEDSDEDSGSGPVRAKIMM